MQISHIDSKKERKKQWVKFSIVFISVVVGVLSLIIIAHQRNVAPAIKNEIKTDFATPLSKVDDETVILEKSQKRASDAEKKASELEEKLAEQDKTQSKMVDEVKRRMDVLEKTLQGNQQQGAIANSVDPFAKDQLDSIDAGQIIRRDKLNLASLKPKVDEYQVPQKTPETYVPAGTFVTGTIVLGADVSAGVTAQSNPEPMHIRLTSDGVLPNKRHSHLQGCFITLAATGDISSERGKIRTETLSCVKSNGEIIDVPVEGTIAGSDGKNGMRGNPVWREGALVQRAFIAGSFSGFSKSLSEMYTTSSISALGSTQTTDHGKIFQVGAAEGATNSMDTIAKYNIQRAEQYHPVIQLSANAKVDVVFLKGFYLDGRKHSDNEEEVAQLSSKSEQPYFPPKEPSQLPLTPEQVARLDEKSKELGLQVKHSNS
jgi:conjugal transfer pilus assembly protein TraB